MHSVQGADVVPAGLSAQYSPSILQGEARSHPIKPPSLKIPLEIAVSIHVVKSTSPHMYTGQAKAELLKHDEDERLTPALFVGPLSHQDTNRVKRRKCE